MKTLDEMLFAQSVVATGALRFLGLSALALVVIFFSTFAISAQTTQFTYQGKLTDGGTPANGQYDF